MRNGLLGSIAALAASAGLALAQAPVRNAGPGTEKPGRAVAQSAPISTEPVPLGPSTLSAPPADGAFYAAMQSPYGGAPGEGQETAERGSVQLDYLLWFIRTMPSGALPLVTASTTGPRGAIGGTTSTVFGAQDIQLNPSSGGRFDLEYWWPRNRRIGSEFIGTVLEARTQTFIAGFGTQMVARPVIDGTTGVPTSLTIAAPGYARGGVQIDASSQLWGFEYNGKYKFWCDENKEVQFLAGFRYLELAESLAIAQRSIFVAGVGSFFYGVPFANPTEIDVADVFETRNQYYLGQLGLLGKWRHNRWTASLAGKIGIGGAHETLVINGNSTLIQTPTSAPNTVPGGLLALSGNIGRYHGDPFVWVPEAAFQIGYRFFNHTELFLGYQFTYISQVLRPADQIDFAVSPNQVPTSSSFGFPGGVNHPTTILKQADFWVQGINFGLRITY